MALGPCISEYERDAQPVAVRAIFRRDDMTAGCAHPSVLDVFRKHGEDLIRGRWPNATVKVGDGPTRDWREYLPFVDAFHSLKEKTPW